MPSRQQSRKQAVFVLAAVLGAVGGAGAQDSRPWTVRAARAAAPPTIDGRIGVEEWSGATVLTDLRQVEPVEGAEPSERTELRLMADANALYVAFRCFDSEPDRIASTQMTRDADLSPDDRVEFVLDTFLDRRNAYFFQTNPTGALGDALIVNNMASFVKSFDTIFESRSSIDAEGWSCEFAVPAKSLSFEPAHAAFGFNFLRHIKRKNELVRWATPVRLASLYQPVTAGTLEGVDMLDPGLGLDVVPHATFRIDRDHRAQDNDATLEPGVDVRWRITPYLTGTVTVNTDFADTEVDDAVVNLTRFPVFFPEKRDFFLEDAGIFTFGGLRDSTSPFYSRRIGLSAAGRPVPLLAGAKLTGRVGDLNVGLLDVLQDDEAGVDGQNLAVARVSANLLEESQLGAIFTYGDPRTNGDNAVAGLDFSYRTREFLDGKVFRLDAFAVASEDSPDPASGLADATGYFYGLTAAYPNDVWRLTVGYRETSDDFRPDLGFIGRRDDRYAYGEFEFRPRIGGGVRRLVFEVNPAIHWSLSDGDITTAEVEIRPAGFELESEDEAYVFITPTHERLDQPFQIADATTLSAGEYDFFRAGAQVETSDLRRLSGRLRFETGSYYDGRGDGFEAEAVLRFPPHARVSLAYKRFHADLPAGSFTTNLWRAKLRVDFSPDVSWSTIAQTDDVSDTLGLQSRVRWIQSPGREAALVFTRNWSTEDPVSGRSRFAPERTELALKLEYLLRF